MLPIHTVAHVLKGCFQIHLGSLSVRRPHPLAFSPHEPTGVPQTLQNRHKSGKAAGWRVEARRESSSLTVETFCFRSGQETRCRLNIIAVSARREGQRNKSLYREMRLRLSRLAKNLQYYNSRVCKNTPRPPTWSPAGTNLSRTTFRTEADVQKDFCTPSPRASPTHHLNENASPCCNKFPSRGSTLAFSTVFSSSMLWFGFPLCRMQQPCFLFNTSCSINIPLYVGFLWMRKNGHFVLLLGTTNKILNSRALTAVLSCP